MTKKTMLIIVLLISLISVVIIAVWGTLPESNNQIQVENITFNDYELNDDNDKILNIIDTVTSDSPYITLTYNYAPDNALSDIYATSSSSDVIVLVDQINKELLINFSTDSAIGQNVTITIIDRKTNEFDELTLIFKIPDIVGGD